MAISTIRTNTDSIPEGVTNLYYEDSRVGASPAISTITANGWVTDARVATPASAATGIDGGKIKFTADFVGSVVRFQQDKSREHLTVADAGASNDGVTDATAGVSAALNKWKEFGGQLVFGPGRYRITSPIIIDLDGYENIGEIVMIGSIVPDAGIGRAITIKNARGGRYLLRVFGGGQTADYTQADPTGADEAFTFVNCYGGVIESICGFDYAGRMLRITSDTPGAGGFQTQWIDIQQIYCNSSAPITGDEATRLAQGVGQAFYIDTGLNAFGRIRHAFMAWETYGSVIEETSDVTFDDAETIYRGSTGLQLRGVISFWGGTLKLGSEKSGWTGDLLLITDSSDRNSQQVSIKRLFLEAGYNGLRAVNVGVTTGQGLVVGEVFSRLNTNVGILLDNCRKFDILEAQCYADVVGLQLTNACDLGFIKIRTMSTKNQGIIIDSAVGGEVEIKGSASDGNVSGGTGVSLIVVSTLNSILFNGFVASSGSVDYLFNLQTMNLVRLNGGQVVTSGSTAIYNNQPNRALDVVGLPTKNKGTATISSGSTSVVVTHGIVKAPDSVLLTPRDAGAVGAYAPLANRTTTQFTIYVATAPSSNSNIDWEVEANYSG